MEATDESKLAALLDPHCGIAFDVSFQIEDDEDWKKIN